MKALLDKKFVDIIKNSDLISCDIETSSDTIEGSILSIAMIKLSSLEETYNEVVYEDGVFMKPAAMRVNRFDASALDKREYNRRFTLAEIDRILSIQFVTKKQQKSILLGAGINYFDAKFIAKDLPLTYSKLNRRMLDVNSFAYATCLVYKLDPAKFKANTYDKFNKTFREFNMLLDEHHALYDARRNIYYLQETMKLISDDFRTTIL